MKTLYFKFLPYFHIKNSYMINNSTIGIVVSIISGDTRYLGTYRICFKALLQTYENTADEKDDLTNYIELLFGTSSIC